MSPQQQLENSKIALRRWMEVPRKNVYPELQGWTNEPQKSPDCGTLACFGGWVAVMPEFVAMGVRRDHAGRPVGLKTTTSDELAWLLFGDSNIFEVTSFTEDRETNYNDHKVVKNRLKSNIKRLQAKVVTL